MEVLSHHCAPLKLLVAKVIVILTNTKVAVQLWASRSACSCSLLGHTGRWHSCEPSEPAGTYQEWMMKILTWFCRIAPAMLRQASYGTIKIGTYQTFKRLLVDRPEGESHFILLWSVTHTHPPDAGTHPPDKALCVKLGASCPLFSFRWDAADERDVWHPLRSHLLLHCQPHWRAEGSDLLCGLCRCPTR